MNIVLWIVIVVLSLLVGFLSFIVFKKKSGTKSLFAAREEAKNILEGAHEDATKIKREASLEAKETLEILENDPTVRLSDGQYSTNLNTQVQVPVYFR